MSLSWLGYPQFVLALWCPLTALGTWRLTDGVSGRLGARERFSLGVVAAGTPPVALLVPYLPNSPLRNLPFCGYRLPGVSATGPAESTYR